LEKIKELDTEEILKIVEYESILNDIESLAMEDAQRE